MPKKTFLLGTEQIADGKVRVAGKIHSLEDATVTALIGRGAGREPTDEEIARMGIEPEPVLNAGQHARDMGTPKLEAAPAAPRSTKTP